MMTFSPMIDSLHHRIGPEGRYYVFPLIGTCIASFFLFLSVFGAPFIPSIYLVQVDFIFTPPKVMSALLGPLGFCRRSLSFEQPQIFCSSPKIGYQLGDMPFFAKHSVPKTSSFAVNTLIIQVITFALSLTAVIFVLLSVFQYKPAAYWSFKIIWALAMFTLASIMIDLSFYLAAKTSYGFEASLQLGNAIWFTLVAWTMVLAVMYYGLTVKRQLGAVNKIGDERAAYAEEVASKCDYEEEPSQSHTADDIVRLRQLLLHTLAPLAKRSSQFQQRYRPASSSVELLESKPASTSEINPKKFNAIDAEVRHMEPSPVRKERLRSILLNRCIFPPPQPDPNPNQSNGPVEIVFAPTIGTLSHVSTFRITYPGSFVDGRDKSLPPTPSSYMPLHRHPDIPKEYNSTNPLQTPHRLRRASYSFSSFKSTIGKFPTAPPSPRHVQYQQDVNRARNEEAVIPVITTPSPV